MQRERRAEGYTDDLVRCLDNESGCKTDHRTPSSSRSRRASWRMSCMITSHPGGNQVASERLASHFSSKEQAAMASRMGIEGGFSLSDALTILFLWAIIFGVFCTGTFEIVVDGNSSTNRTGWYFIKTSCPPPPA